MEHEILKIHKKPCPLCNQEAEWIYVHLASKRKFKCPNCSIFLISPLLEETIAVINKSEKKVISKKSTSCGKNTMLHIYKKENIIHFDCVPVDNWT